MSVVHMAEYSGGAVFLPLCLREASGNVVHQLTEVTCVPCLHAAIGERRMLAIQQLDRLREARIAMLEAEVARLKGALAQAGLDSRPLSVAPVDIDHVRKSAEWGLSLAESRYVVARLLLAIIDRLEGKS